MQSIGIKDFTFYYEKYEALKNINFSITGASFTCLVGPNGSRK